MRIDGPDMLHGGAFVDEIYAQEVWKSVFVESILEAFICFLHKIAEHMGIDTFITIAEVKLYLRKVVEDIEVSFFIAIHS